MNKWIKRILITIAVIFSICTSVRIYLLDKGEDIMVKYGKQHTSIPFANAYLEGAPRAFTPAAKGKVGILLLHGYISSPSTFDDLFPHLEAAGLPYYAPTLTGHGMGDFHLLSVCKPSDWFRDVLYAYDVLATQVEEVHIVATSMAAVLATRILAERPVSKLCLVVPNFRPGKSNVIAKKLLSTPFLRSIFRYTVPVLPAGDAMKRVEFEKRFSYPVYEINSVETMFKLQDQVSVRFLKGAKIPPKIDVVYAMNDPKSDVKLVTQEFDKWAIPYSLTAFEADHELFSSQVSEDVFKHITEFLKNE